jgi:N-methylhydantoinase B
MAISASNSPDHSAVAIDLFTLEIIRNYFLSTVREMISVTIQAAYSTCFSEGVDFSCALFDEKGHLFAQAGGNPVHYGALEDQMEIIQKKAGVLEEGDVLIHNDPYEGACHQSDVVIAMPIFYESKLVGFSVNRGHWTDIGSMFAGGYGVSGHVVQEALIIPASKLYERGQLCREIQEFILKNVRMPRLIWGDIQAQVSSARAAAERFRKLMERYGPARVRGAIQHSLDYAYRRFREGMDSLPNGTYHAEDVFDDDGFGGGPYRIRVTTHKTTDKIVVDFEGSDSQAPGVANVTLAVTKAATYTALKALIDPETPVNSGILDLVEIRTPLGTIVDPTYPAPVCCAPDMSGRICEVVMKCWIETIPERVIAGSYSTGMQHIGWGFKKGGEEFLWYGFGGGGCGARQNRDGLTIEWHTMASCANESMEIWEARYPLRYVRRELRTDSGGPGRSRGGMGDIRVIELLTDTVVNGFVDRFASQPWGIYGGLPGASNGLAVEREGVEYKFTELCGVPCAGKFANVPLRNGDRYIVRSGGGGGYGPPHARHPELVARDVRNGYVSLEVARDLHKVAIRPDGSVDSTGTAALRRDV